MRRATAVLTAALTSAVLFAAGCSSSGGSGPKSSTAPSSGAPTSSAAGALSAKLQAAVTALTSAHLDIDAGALGGKISGDIALQDGKTTASDLSLDQGGQIEVRTVGGVTYAKLPPAHNTTGKPWATVSAKSTNEFVRGLAGNLQLVGAVTSIGEVTSVLAAAATNVQDVGKATVGGMAVEHYTLTIDPSKATGTLGSALSLAGGKPLPLDLYLDARNRPVQVKLSQPVAISVTLSKFDAPVSITAPPANQTTSS